MFESLFQPRGIVVIGASENPNKLGFQVAQNLVLSNYQGAISFVNPKGGRLFNRAIYSKLEEIPEPADLAVILIPARFVPDALEDCGLRGIPFAIISSSGFREVGGEGEELEKRCLDIARRHGMHILGPNCIGILDTHVPLNTTFLPPPGPIQGGISFLSHSGATCAAVIDWTRDQGIGFSKLVSFGNQMDLNETDLLGPIADDPNTSVITMYLESISEGTRFVEFASSISEKVPILALKVGRSERGLSAVASHTGAMAGQDIAYDAAFDRAGVIRAHSIEQMFGWARALTMCPLPRGKNVAVLTNAGGLGVIATDAIVDHGMNVVDLEAKTLAQLEQILPAEASFKNPVDMLASAGPPEYAKALTALIHDEGADSILIIIPPPPITPAEEYVEAIIPVVKDTVKPVVVALMGGTSIRRAAEILHAAEIPNYAFPDQAASALGVLLKRAEWLTRKPQAPVIFSDLDQTRAETTLEAAERSKEGFLDAITASQIVSSYCIEVPEDELAGSAQEASSVARRIGFPVVLKLISRELTHKTDVGGVILSLKSAEQVADAYGRMMHDFQAQHPEMIQKEVQVQKMIEGGQEVILGVVRDPQFGLLMMFGSGGIEVEGVGDVAFALVPENQSDAGSLIEKTWAGRKLSGYRNFGPADRDAVIDVMLRLGQLVKDFPQITEVEINPLKVLPQSEGAVAIDVRIRVK